MSITFFQNNPWVGYAERDYLVMKQNIITKMQNPITGLPEITDHSESNPFIKRVSIWCGINEQLGYYVDNKGREAFLMSARLLKSIYLLAKQYDYRVRGLVASTGEVTFSIDVPAPNDFTIPLGTKIAIADGSILFETLSDCTILSGTTSINVQVKQWVKNAASIIGQSDGQANQTFELTETVVDNSIAVIVNGITPYTSVESFVLTENTSEVFKCEMNINGKMQIVFGDAVNGKIPPLNQDISIEYYECLGAKGNVAAGAITKIVSVIALPVGVNELLVNNANRTVNGTDAEGINSLKKLIPLSLRTLYRAVTPQDYVDVTELAPGVARAGISYSCGKYVDIYIAPNGGGIASQTLMDNTQLFLDDKRMVTTFTRIFSAGLIIVEYELIINALPNFYNSVVQANVIAAMQEFHDVQNQKIKGSIKIGDIYQLIENTSGVDFSQVKKMRPLPYARPLNTTSPVLQWTRKQFQNAANATYRLTFVSASTFKLMRNNVYLGSFNVGVLITTVDLEFTVSINGTAGDMYEFKSYEVNNAIILDEPSLPAFDTNYLTISVTGGLI